MIRKCITVILVLLVCSRGFSQSIREFDGKDSVRLTITKDTTGKFIYIRESLKNGEKTDTASFKREDLVYARLKKDILTDSLRKLAETFVREKLASDTTIAIRIKKTPATPTAAAPTDTLPSIQTEGATGSAAPTQTKTLLFVIVGGLAVLGGLIYILFIRRRKKTPQPSDLTTADGEPVREVLPGTLTSFFKLSKNKKQLSEQADAIIKAYQDKETELKNAQEQLAEVNAKNSNLKAEKESLETIIAQREQTIVERNDEITALQKKILDTDEAQAHFKMLAETIVNKYFTELNSRIRNNETSDRNEIERMILQNVFAIAFHSVSLHKKQIKDATDLDELNVRLLTGNDVTPQGIITDTSSFNTSSPLAYHVYQLLKAHGITNLEGVLIQGQKIGTS